MLNCFNIKAFEKSYIMGLVKSFLHKAEMLKRQNRQQIKGNYKQ